MRVPALQQVLIELAHRNNEIAICMASLDAAF